MTDQLSSADILKVIRNGYPPDAYAVLTEVANTTGAGQSRYADAVAMSLWPSRGLGLHGFEIKVSRGDWLSELKNPAKSSEIQKYCDHWWIVTPDTEIILENELPVTWGHYVVKNGRLKVKVKAPRLCPEPMSLGFIAAIFRRQAEILDELKKEAWDSGYEQGKLDAKNPEMNAELAVCKRDFERLKDSLDLFEEKSGLKIGEWNGSALGETVAFIERFRNCPFGRAKLELERQKKNLENHFNDQINVLKTLELFYSKGDL